MTYWTDFSRGVSEFEISFTDFPDSDSWRLGISGTMVEQSGICQTDLETFKVDGGQGILARYLHFKVLSIMGNYGPALQYLKLF